MRRKAILLTTLGVLALAGCEEKDPVLTGERLNVRDVLETRAPAEGEAQTVSRAFSAPQMVNNANWTQSAVSPSVRTTNAALSSAPQPLFSAPIGAGDSRRLRLDAEPVVADGRIFTMDARSVVKATGLNGEALWSTDLTPPREKTSLGEGGGLAVGGGRLYVTSAYGELVALDPATGAKLWTQEFGNTSTGAPSYADGLVYAVSGDTTGWAVEAADGKVRWQLDGQGDVGNVAGGPAPAIGDQHVIFSYGSGTVQGAFRQGGLRLWSSELLGRRPGVTLAGFDDVTGDPVISGDTVFAGNHSGRVAAMSVYTGERIWEAPYGAEGPMWPAGDSVFFVSDLNQLVRLDAATGQEIWTADLPGYVQRRKPNKRRDSAYANMGPIMAGGRLIVAGSDGQLRAFNPADGTLVQTIDVPGGATTRPVVAGGTLYVVSKKGVLHAYR
ncbi:PQQ-like beta-propeller repeat protein [Sagittula stellata]|uniref:PQQ enzyme repeat family protein n=1 Tax=Sagittula stellata (strain ATCC 700073 / DSM 11524 / E-37) TaxID=388399 RepID=A3K9Z3_SAGS3|nr:PQQ-like beta-propeller repeat protein [Sagittula stellata]EBA05936.1 PQQ enzyme repeat family protein [Sagittula stellata E-37]